MAGQAQGHQWALEMSGTIHPPPPALGREPEPQLCLCLVPVPPRPRGHQAPEAPPHRPPVAQLKGRRSLGLEGPSQAQSHSLFGSDVSEIRGPKREVTCPRSQSLPGAGQRPEPLAADR